MVATARMNYPALRFDLGSIHALDLEGGALRGITAWYSVIHTPPKELPAIFEEFSRVLADDGYVALAFQVGNECLHIENGYGHPVSLDAYRVDPSKITDHSLRRPGSPGSPRP